MRGLAPRRRLVAMFAMGVVGAGIVLFASAGASADPGPGYGTSTPSPIVYTTSQEPLLIHGQSDLSAGTSAGGASTASAMAESRAQSTGHTAAPFGPPPSHPNAGSGTFAPLVTANSASDPAGSTDSNPLAPGTYPGTVGFPGISGQEDAAADNGAVEPPDQGLCVGDKGGPNATVMEIINNSLQAFSPSGTPESPVIPTTQLFDLQPSAFLSDPRCYWDQSTRRWFFQEFTFDIPATQYIAVSQTSNALGKYTVFQFDTTDANAPAGNNCPCFGDYDQQGADANGYYISTNEFSNVTGQFNGTDLWAMSKHQLVAAADLQAPPPPVDRYAVTADAFTLPYHVSPSQTPPNGSYFPNTELFVESNSDLNVDDHLLVYAMTDTKLLDSGGFPSLEASELTSQTYTFPQNAQQNPAGSCGTCTIDTDFNAIQQVTESHGILYAELDSGGAYNSVLNAGEGPAQAEWFILDPEQSNPQSVELLNQGVVSSPGTSIMYPDIAVDGAGDGYLIFSASGPSVYPSPGYVAFDKYSGPDGPSLMPTTGVNDEDGFTCYPPYGVPGDPFNDCRWGDYSMGVAYENRIFMAAEYIPPPGVPAPAPVNFGTYIWSAPQK